MNLHTWYPYSTQVPQPSPFGHKPAYYSQQVWDLYIANYISRPSQAEIIASNEDRFAVLAGQHMVPCLYLHLFNLTKEFVKGVEGIAHVAEKAGTEFGMLGAGALLIDFSVHILRGKDSRFHIMLNSQRLSIYQLLDTALLRILLSAWESESPSEREWPETIGALASDISKAMANIPAWADLDSCDMLRNKGVDNGLYMEGANHWPDGEETLRTWYFARTRKFLEESLATYWTKRKVNTCVRGWLPMELVDDIVDYVLEYERLPTGMLRGKYFPKGKEKMVDTRE